MLLELNDLSNYELVGYGITAVLTVLAGVLVYLVSKSEDDYE